MVSAVPSTRLLRHAHAHCLLAGETGLDFNRNFSPPDVQEIWFDAQVALAAELGKPLFMHCRDAGERFAAILRSHGDRGGVPGCLHCFTGVYVASVGAWCMEPDIVVVGDLHRSECCSRPHSTWCHAGIFCESFCYGVDSHGQLKLCDSPSTAFRHEDL